jgi:hypothetical protein
MTAPKPWEMARNAPPTRWARNRRLGRLQPSEHCGRQRAALPSMHARSGAVPPRPGSPEYRAALRAVETKAYRWLLARLGLR